MFKRPPVVFTPKTAPRSIVVVGGYAVPFDNWTVDCTGFDSADTFTIQLPFTITDGHADSIVGNSPDSESLLLTSGNILVEVYRGVPRDHNNFTIQDLTRNIYGYVDTMNFNFDNQGEGERVTIVGRNLASFFIDNKITEKYPNRTSSQIASMFANKYGLTAQVTPTSTLAGTYYNKDATTLTSLTSEWDLLMYLAQKEGYVCRVKDTTLFFGSASAVTETSLAPINMVWGGNIETLEIDRSPNAARDLEVQVISYDRNHKHRIVATAKSTTQYSARLTDQLNRARYLETYSMPGLTRDQAQARANNILKQLSATELVGTLTTNGEYGFTVDRRINLAGLGRGLDGIYYANRVTESFDMTQGGEGFKAEVAFINELLTSGASI